MAHPRKRNEAEDRKRLRHTLKRSQTEAGPEGGGEGKEATGEGGLTDG
ncbi:MAG: hypothetical protein V3R61_03760 [candidate division NC10 bacterium]